MSTFLDISKAFHSVWHDGLIYNVKSFRISDTPLKLIENFLSNRYQRVVRNGQPSSWPEVSAEPSSWPEVSAGVSQGSILGALVSSILAVDYFQQANFLLKMHPFSQWSTMSQILPIN